MNLNIKDLQKNWNELGRIDPLWSVLTWRAKKGGKWNLEEFFATGKAEIDSVMEYAKSLGVCFPRGRALDFGCGVGRVTQPLADYFDEVCGVDIASSMIELANAYNRRRDKCKYYLNEKDDLRQFSDDSFDFVYSNITLQHMEPRYFKNYIREFLRVLNPNGLLIFQLPSEPARTIEGIAIRFVPQVLLNVYRRGRYSGRPIIEMHGMKREDVVEFLEHNGARLVDVKEDQSSGQDWISFRYCVVKKKRMA